MKKVWKYIVVGILLGLLIAAVGGFWAYQKVFGNNVALGTGELLYVQIPTGAEYEEVIQIFEEQDVILDMSSFKWVAEQMNYPNNIKSGNYELEPGMSNRDMLVKLRMGDQTPVDVVFNVVRTKGDLAAIVSSQIEADSSAIYTILADSMYWASKTIKPEEVMAYMIPNTYEFYWNTSAEEYVERILEEHNRFWNEDRMAKAASVDLTPEEVFTLASIVEQETNKHDEKSRMAGVYLNRLEDGWKLQADPTVKFALGDFAIKRVLQVHLQHDSPYNTYMYVGLPPGPICTPTITTIDAVLNAESHDFYYFCAKSDFSGYHSFAKTLTDHLANAALYHAALDAKGY